jgi:hypothetical protein
MNQSEKKLIESLVPNNNPVMVGDKVCYIDDAEVYYGVIVNIQLKQNPFVVRFDDGVEVELGGSKLVRVPKEFPGG